MIFLALDTHDAIEVGENIGVGGMVFPAIEADALWIVTKPSGETIEIRGRANRLGIVRGETLVPANEPGIYSIKTAVTWDGMVGDIVGTKDGVYWHCAIPRDNPPLLKLSGAPVRSVDPSGVTDIILTWPTDLETPTIHYGLIMPGQVLDQGIEKPDENQWSYPLEPMQIATQFPNFDVRYFGTGKPALADTVVFQFFMEATRNGQKVYDSLRLVLRGDKLYNFAAIAGE